MDYFTKKRLAFWGVTLLVIMNLSSLVTVWYLQHQKPAESELKLPPINRVMDFIKNELELSELQTNQFVSIIEDHFKKVEIILYSIKDIKIELFNELLVNNPDDAKVDRLFKEIGDKHIELEKLEFYHFLELKNLCTTEQKNKLKLIFRELLPQIGPPGFSHGRTPPGRPDFPRPENLLKEN